jgi:hypothetical protein
MNQRKLKKELRLSGASKNDAQLFTDLANQLSAARLPHLTQDGRERIESRLPIEIEATPHHLWYKKPLVVGFASSFAVFMVTITLIAQTAPNTSPLYNIKKGTDYIRGLWDSEEAAAPETDKTIETMQPSENTPQPELEYLPDHSVETEVPTDEKRGDQKRFEESSRTWRKNQRTRNRETTRDSSDRYQNWWRW